MSFTLFWEVTAFFFSGEKYTVKVTDLSGFECFEKNDISQFFINCLNEQLQYLYLQRIFSWERLEMNEDDIRYTPIPYYNNKTALDQMLSRFDGVLALIDEATNTRQSGKYVLGKQPSHDHKEYKW